MSLMHMQFYMCLVHAHVLGSNHWFHIHGMLSYRLSPGECF